MNFLVFVVLFASRIDAYSSYIQPTSNAWGISTPTNMPTSSPTAVPTTNEGRKKSKRTKKQKSNNGGLNEQHGPSDGKSSKKRSKKQKSVTKDFDNSVTYTSSLKKKRPRAKKKHSFGRSDGTSHPEAPVGSQPALTLAAQTDVNKIQSRSIKKARKRIKQEKSKSERVTQVQRTKLKYDTIVQEKIHLYKKSKKTSKRKQKPTSSSQKSSQKPFGLPDEIDVENSQTDLEESSGSKKMKKATKKKHRNKAKALDVERPVSKDGNNNSRKEKIQKKQRKKMSKATHIASVEANDRSTDDDTAPSLEAPKLEKKTALTAIVDMAEKNEEMNAEELATATGAVEVTKSTKKKRKKKTKMNSAKDATTEDTIVHESKTPVSGVTNVMGSTEDLLVVHSDIDSVGEEGKGPQDDEAQLEPSAPVIHGLQENIKFGEPSKLLDEKNLKDVANSESKESVKIVAEDNDGDSIIDMTDTESDEVLQPDDEDEASFNIDPSLSMNDNADVVSNSPLGEGCGSETEKMDGVTAVVAEKEKKSPRELGVSHSDPSVSMSVEIVSASSAKVSFDTCDQAESEEAEKMIEAEGSINAAYNAEAAHEKATGGNDVDTKDSLAQLDDVGEPNKLSLNEKTNNIPVQSQEPEDSSNLRIIDESFRKEDKPIDDGTSDILSSKVVELEESSELTETDDKTMDEYEPGLLEERPLGDNASSKNFEIEESSNVSETEDQVMDVYEPSLLENDLGGDVASTGENGRIVSTEINQTGDASLMPVQQEALPVKAATGIQSSGSRGLDQSDIDRETQIHDPDDDPYLEKDVVRFIGNFLEEDVQSWLNETTEDGESGEDNGRVSYGTSGNETVAIDTSRGGFQEPTLEKNADKHGLNGTKIESKGEDEHGNYDDDNADDDNEDEEDYIKSPTSGKDGYDEEEDLIAVQEPNDSSSADIASKEPSSINTEGVSQEQQANDISAAEKTSERMIPWCRKSMELSEDKDTDAVISVVTWNLAEESPSEEDASFIRRFRKLGISSDKGSDLVLIAGQECENIKPRRTEGRRSREYRRLMIKMLGKGYMPIALHLLGGIQFGLVSFNRIDYNRVLKAWVFVSR